MNSNPTKRENTKDYRVASPVILIECISELLRARMTKCKIKPIKRQNFLHIPPVDLSPHSSMNKATL